MTQQPLFVPSSAGWYPCPGDPPGITRHWDGKEWLCEIHGPIRDHFEYLRAGSVQGLAPDDQALLRQLTAEVSRIEDLVLAAPTANPPLVQIVSPPPYVPPPIDPYTSAPLPTHAMAGTSLSMGNGQRFAPTGRGTGRQRKVVVAVIAGVGILALVALRLAVMGIFPFFAAATASEPLTVSSCVTLSYPSDGTDSRAVAWISSGCKTLAGGPVSYTVVSKLPGSAACDENAHYVQTLNSRNDIANTYCLMENLTVGQCLFEDGKGFYFDVPCTDSRAGLKVSISADQGSDYACPNGTKPWRFPAGNRTYCLAKP